MSYLEEMESAEDNAKLSATLLFEPEGVKVGATSSALVPINPASQSVVDGRLEMDRKWASLETGRIKLDGSYFFKDDGSSYAPAKKWGMWGSQLSGLDGTFSNPQIVKVKLASPFGLPGVTVTFDDKGEEFAVDFSVSYYTPNGVLQTKKKVEGNTKTNAMVKMAGAGVGEIRIEITKWSEPERFFKVCEITPGVSYLFTDEDVYSFELNEEISPFGSNMPIPEATFVIDNSDQNFNVLNPQGVAQFLRRAMQIKTRVSAGGETKNASEWFLSEWSSDQNNMTASFTLQPKIAFLPSYSNAETTTTTVEAVAHNILPGLDLEVDERIKNKIVNKSIGKDVSASAAMQQLANAVGAVLLIGRDNTYRLTPYLIPDRYRAINENSLFQDITVNQEWRPKQIVGTYNNYNIQEGKWENHTHTLSIPNGQGEDFKILSEFPRTLQTVVEMTEMAKRNFIDARLRFKGLCKGDFAIRPYVGLWSTVEFGEASIRVLKTKTTYGKGIVETEFYGHGSIMEDVLDAPYSNASYSNYRS